MRLHEIKACSVTEQEKETLLPRYFTTLLGGFVTNFGGGHTTNVVVAAACPKRFVALHSYEPESLFIAVCIVMDSLNKVTLLCGKTPRPVSFVHVAVGDGKPVTWHRGSLMFCPVLA